MGSHQFLTLLACFLCAVLSAIAVNQIALATETPVEVVAEQAEAPAARAPIRL